MRTRATLISNLQLSVNGDAQIMVEDWVHYLLSFTGQHIICTDQWLFKMSIFFYKLWWAFFINGPLSCSFLSFLTKRAEWYSLYIRQALQVSCESASSFPANQWIILMWRSLTNHNHTPVDIKSVTDVRKGPEALFNICVRADVLHISYLISVMYTEELSIGKTSPGSSETYPSPPH